MAAIKRKLSRYLELVSESYRTVLHIYLLSFTEHHTMFSNSSLVIYATVWIFQWDVCYMKRSPLTRAMPFMLLET